MSASASANDLGSMGAPSSDTALAPLIAALTANTTALGANTDKLDSLQTVTAALSTGINSLRVGIERLVASLSKKSVKGGGGGGNGGGSGKDELQKLEEKWLKREDKDRLAYLKKKQAQEQKFLDISAQHQPKQEAHVEAYTQRKEEIKQWVDESNKRILQQKLDKGMAYGPTRKEFEVGKKKQEKDKAADLEVIAAIDARNQQVINDAEEKSARKLWREGLEKQAELQLEAAMKALAKQEEYNAALDKVIKSKQEDEAKGEAAAKKWREGLNQIAQRKADEKLAEVQHYDKQTHATDRGGPGSLPGGGMSFSSGPIAKAGMLLYSAVNMAVAGFNKLHSSVDALAKSAMIYAPGIAIAMERALKDLDAVVGAYSAKVGSAMIPIVQIVSDYMFPTMKALGDAVAAVVKSFTPLVETIMMILMPVVTGLANIFTFLWKLLSPVIDILTTLFNTIGMSFAFLIGVVNGVIDALSAFFAPLFTVFDLFGEQLMLAAEVAKQFAIKITEWIPYIGAAVKEALKPSSTQGLAAASSARMTSAAAISETVAQNAFIASSGGKDPSKAFAQQMLDNDIPNKWAKDLDARGGKQGNPNVRKDDGFVGDGGGGDWNQGQPLHGRNNAPIRMGA